MSAGAVELVETDASAAGPLVRPFDEQTAFDVASRARVLYALHAVRRTQVGTVVGSAVLGQGALDLHLEPEFRARGLGHAAAAALLDRAGDGPLAAWSHEDHPAARALAARFGFDAVRTLLKLRLDGLDRAETGLSAAPAEEPGFAIGAFRPGTDDAEWLALNARVFAWHPEQGGVTQRDLDERMREPWFRAEDFLIARDGRGRMIGYNWLKQESTSSGEIYVIGVAPESAGHGLGRALMAAGLARLRERGCAEATLYVEGDNERGIRLYRSLGFTTIEAHVQYARKDA